MVDIYSILLFELFQTPHPPLSLPPLRPLQRQYKKRDYQKTT